MGKKFHTKVGGVSIEINLSRFDKRMKKAQEALDGEVMSDMVPFMPMVTGQFIGVTRAASDAIRGSGTVYAGVGPQSRFLYEGKVMVGEESGSPFAMKGERKVVTDRPLNYTKTTHPDATDHWFDAAKKKDGKKWIRMVKRIVGGGN